MDNLLDSNPNKIQPNNRRIVLQYSLYGIAKDLFEGIADEQLASVDGVDYVLKAVHKRERLSVVTLVFGELQSLLLIQRGASEKHKDLESQFGAQLGK